MEESISKVELAETKAPAPDFSKVLKEFELRITEQRQLVLEVLFNEQRALTFAEIESKLENQLDRVTLYRTLKTFTDKGLLHEIADSGKVSKYAFRDSNAEENAHNHLHFTCIKCKTTTCLESVELPEIVLPNGYSINNIHFHIKGNCNECNASV